VRILVVYRGLPWPIWEGYHLRILHLFRRLRERHAVHLLSLLHEEGQDRHLPELEAEGLFASIQTFRLPPRSRCRQLLDNLRGGGAESFRAQWPGFRSRLQEAAQETVERTGAGVAYVFDPWADLWWGAVKPLPTLLDVCDCRTLYYERKLERGGLGPRERLRTRQLRARFRRIETTLLGEYPLATVVSPADREALLRLRPGCRVEVVPNGVDLEMFAPLPETPEEPGHLVMFGNMDFEPNVDAAVRFAREMLPRVRERHPEARFTVLGSNPLPEVRALEEIPGVAVTGLVPELRPWLQRAVMLAAPMRLGAGLKNKVLEALAMEKAVVTSPSAVEALHPEVARHVVLADPEDPAAFAAAVSAVLDDEAERRRRARAGRQAVAQHHSWEAAARRYEELLAGLAGAQ